MLKKFFLDRTIKQLTITEGEFTSCFEHAIFKLRRKIQKQVETELSIEHQTRSVQPLPVNYDADLCFRKKQFSM